MLTEYWPAFTNHLPIMLFVGVLLLERALPIPIHMHPFGVFRQMAQQLALRVHPSCTRPRSQQRISGLMAMLLMLLLWVAVPALLYGMAELKLWFGAVILWLSLASQPWLREAQLIQGALQREQKQLARARLQRWLNRECASLSPLGIEKAASEQCVQRQLQAWFGVLFWFALGGPIMALLYRCCFELDRAWPSQLPYWRDFGAVNHALFKLLNWPPYIITLALLALINVTMALLARDQKITFNTSHFNHHEQQLYYLLSRIFALELGGPIKFQAKKIHRQRFSHPQALTVNRIYHTILRLTFIQIALFVIAFALFSWRTL